MESTTIFAVSAKKKRDPLEYPKYARDYAIEDRLAVYQQHAMALRRELAKVRTENEILKKAASFSAKEKPNV